uniref:Predicted protein n=1 Tax=Hordeum vulgare subsp. vulgare TaxID=112509 RepID=F2DPQ9_HORVV|nr:predicted protein [Hordeum vulgare subsp. vulgare]
MFCPCTDRPAIVACRMQQSSTVNVYSPRLLSPLLYAASDCSLVREGHPSSLSIKHMLASLHQKIWQITIYLF